MISYFLNKIPDILYLISYLIPYIRYLIHLIRYLICYIRYLIYNQISYIRYHISVKINSLLDILYANEDSI